MGIQHKRIFVFKFFYFALSDDFTRWLNPYYFFFFFDYCNVKRLTQRSITEEILKKKKKKTKAVTHKKKTKL